MQLEHNTSRAGVMRQKSLPRRLLSDAFRAIGLAYFDMCLGETRLDSLTSCEAGNPARIQPIECEETFPLAELDELSSPDRMERNLRLGSHTYGAVLDGRIVGFAWTNDRVLELLAEEIQALPAGWMLIHHVFVDPQHRNGGVFQKMLLELYRSSREAGFSTSACLVDRANGPALTAFQRLGAQFRSAPIIKLPVVGMRFLRSDVVPR